MRLSGLARSLSQISERPGMNQAQLAELIGVTQPYVSAIILQKKLPTLQKVADWAEKLEVPAGWLAFGDTVVTEETAELVDLFGEMSPEQQQNLLQTARIFAGKPATRVAETRRESLSIADIRDELVRRAAATDIRSDPATYAALGECALALDRLNSAQKRPPAPTPHAAPKPVNVQ